MWEKISIKQPEVNLRLTKGMREERMSLTKMNNVLTGMVVTSSNYRNMIIQDKRMMEVINNCFEVIIQQNRKEHISACRSVPKHKVNIIWVDKDRTQHCTAFGPASIDGAGLTRAYNHCTRGVQSEFLIISLLTQNNSL